MTENKRFDWIDFYTELANKLLPFAEKRTELISKIKNVFKLASLNLPKLEEGGNVYDIDPFTVFGLFNKGITEENRIRILTGFKKEFGVSAPVPASFEGIPVLNNLSATFYYFGDSRGEHDIDNLWDVYQYAIKYADKNDFEALNMFIECYDRALHQLGIKWNITMALFWIRPFTFLNLDSRNRDFLREMQKKDDYFILALPSLNDFNSVPDGTTYYRLCKDYAELLSHSNYPFKNFPEMSAYAWSSTQVKVPPKVNILSDETMDNVRYWLYSPGDGASLWDEFYSKGIMAIGWDKIGDLNQYSSKSDMKAAMKEKIDPSVPYTMAGHATWQFAREIKPGDIVFAKKGRSIVVGRGIVESDYIFDDSREEYKNIRKVKWTHKGEWPHPGAAAMKTLTDITPYTEYVEKLNALFESDIVEDVEEKEVEYPPYDAESFLHEVYMDEDSYNMLVALVRNKKNVILQGAPGVGKTFAAKRLAYSMMGVKDPKRVMMVQFHQSYSYEDFIMGFRPSGSDFILKRGAFYNFCKEAEIDSDNEYFFIIDEINRGNLSKIFGELFMLIESDKRGVELQLLYSDEKFSVPSNVYIIGMMNTADRSLAMLDYALRRRFAFYEMKPGFETDGFRKYRMRLASEKFDRLINCVERLNTAIATDDSLGEGFCIGHSYFCNLKDPSDQTLSGIVEFELIPLLKEYWFDEPTKVKDWAFTLRSAIS